MTANMPSPEEPPSPPNRGLSRLPHRHVAGLDADTPIVLTEQLQVVDKIVSDCVTLNAPGLIYGEPGLGKTVAVIEALEATKAPYRYYATEHAPAGKIVLQGLLRTFDLPVPSKATQAELLRILIDRLEAERTVLCIDEVQANSVGSFRTLRQIIDTPIPTPLIIVGDDRARDVMHKREKPLFDRMMCRFEVQSLPRDEIVDVMSDYHPIFAATSEKMLLQIDRQYALGRFRNWAYVLSHAIHNASNFDGIDHINDAYWRFLSGHRLP